MGDASENEEYSYILTERDFVSMLIDLYRNRPELWKVQHPGYIDKQARTRALDEMVKELQSYRPDFNEEQARKKINILRTNFRKERQKVAAARRRGDEDYKPGLWYYNELLFLSDQLKVRRKRKSTDTEDDAEQKYFLASDQNESVQSPPTKRQHTKQTSQEHDLKNITVTRNKIVLEEEEDEEKSEPEQYMTVTTSYYKKPKTKEDIIAKNWAMKLKKLSGEQKLFAEKIINDVLFEGELGNLTKNGVSFCTSE